MSILLQISQQPPFMLDPEGTNLQTSSSDVSLIVICIFYDGYNICFLFLA